jgi:hypothetical protein
MTELKMRTSILDALESDLRSTGFAGPTDVPKLVFLCLYTRFFEKPVSMVIKGPSGSGKSFALQAGLQFIPSDAYQAFSGMSEKALVYMNDVDLKHRYLVIGEAAGLTQGDGRAFLRQLLSEGSIRYRTVQKTSTGVVGQELKPIEGPVGLLMTTTANALHPEDESRMLSYHLDESSERIREALLSQALGIKSNHQPLDTEPWFALHRMVGESNLSVDIPFAEVLAHRLPLHHYRVMRDFPQLVSLIRAHTLMHSCTRQRGTDDQVISTIADYAAVYNLVAEPLAQGLEEAVPAQVRAVVETVRTLQGPPDPTAPRWDVKGVSQVQIAEAMNRDQSVIGRHISKAIWHGFLTNLTPGQGRKANVVIGDRELPSGTVLPSPEELQEAMLSLTAERLAA